MFTSEKTFTVISSSEERMAQYIKNVLGSGGCNTFPDHLVSCECGAKVRSNCEELVCPSCGRKLKLPLEESFSSWSFNHS